MLQRKGPKRDKADVRTLTLHLAPWGLPWVLDSFDSQVIKWPLQAIQGQLVVTGYGHPRLLWDIRYCYQVVCCH